MHMHSTELSIDGRHLRSRTERWSLFCFRLDMKLRFETVGNAILQLFENDKPILATDPWLTGTAYFGSWALDHELTDQQIRNVIQSPYVWISHGHPDHLHPESIDLLSPEQEILLPNQYFAEIADWFREKGFEVRILKFQGMGATEFHHSSDVSRK